MKQNAIRLLLALNLALAAALAWLWVDAQGQWRNTRWQPPLPVQPDFAGLASSLPVPQAPDIAKFIATLERPLFTPSRKPAPPKSSAVAAAEPPPDPLANIHLFGLFGGAESGGMLVRIDGKNKRIVLNETFGGWTLQSIRGREATVVRNGEMRVLSLLQARPASLPASKADAPANVPVAASSPVVITTPEQEAQRREEAQRDRLRRRNELRAKAGAPPITQ